MKKFMKTAFLALICVVISVLAITVSAADVYDTSLPFDKELLYGRNALAEMENGNRHVELYDCIYKGIENRETEIDLKEFYMDFMLGNITYGVVILAYRYDNPQHFWVDYGREDNFTVYHNGKGDCYIEISYIDDVNKDTARDKFKAAAEQFIVDAGVKEGMSEYEISLLIHDAVVNHVEYDEEFAADNIYNAYGALIGKKAVCEGYAELYQYLLYLCGIQSHAVTGKANGDHMWNLVRIDGEYYMTDTTWDDPLWNNTGRIAYEYLNVTREKMELEGREIDDNGYQIPDCNSTKANYYNNYFYNMSNFKDQPLVENAITQIKYNGEARFHYNGNGTYSFVEFQKWCNENIEAIKDEVLIERGIVSPLYSCIQLYNEYILTITNVDIMPLPEIQNIPKITAICVDTEVKVNPSSNAGGVAVCRIDSGISLSETDIQELLNNTAVEVGNLVNGNVATGSKLIFGNEKALIAVLGDVDGDGILTVFDANMAQKGDISFQNGYELQGVASDVNGDDIADKVDSQLILNQIVS
ncbi:MAG: hypothetical protein IKU48_06045 [Clostridia bacterium]|nr:hypothetical protein [Clostridia bacterium]